MLKLEYNKIEDLEDFFESYTIQFFKKTVDKGVVPHCCGVTFKFENNLFILTAAHCIFDEQIPDLYVRTTSNEMVSLEFEKLIWYTESEVDNYDKIDVAFIEIKTDYLKNLLQISYKFLSLEDLKFGHNQIQQKSIKIPLKYFMYGYPANQSKLIEKDGISWKIKGLTLFCGLNNINLENLISENFLNHYFINYTKKGISKTNTKQHLPNFKGMSGCGLWIPVIDSFQSNHISAKCIGLFYGRERNVFVFTKIEYAIQLIRNKSNLLKLPKYP